MSRPKKNRKNQPNPTNLRDQILADFATEYGIPLEAALGGSETL